MQLDWKTFENGNAIPPIFMEWDESPITDLPPTYFSERINGRAEVVRMFHRPMSNLPIKLLGISKRDEIF